MARPPKKADGVAEDATAPKPSARQKAATPKAAVPKPATGRQVELTYSKAFDNFVRDNSEDVEGLLGYALYKRSIREQCKRGAISNGQLRDPPDAEVEIYRSAARAKIEEVLEDFELQAAEEWKQSYYDTRLETWKGEIKALIRNRTTTTSAIMSNMAAWALTLVITVAVYIGVKASSLEDYAIARIDAAEAGSGPADP